MKLDETFHTPRPGCFYRKYRPNFGDLALHLRDRTNFVAEVIATVRRIELKLEADRRKAGLSVLGKEIHSCDLKLHKCCCDFGVHAFCFD